MAGKKFVQHDKPEIGPAARVSLDEEIVAHEARYAAIVAEQPAPTPERARRYEECVHYHHSDD